MTPAVVACLHCHKRYALRLGRLRVMQNDACPCCGYVGWSYVETRRHTKAATRVAARVSVP